MKWSLVEDDWERMHVVEVGGFKVGGIATYVPIICKSDLL